MKIVILGASGLIGGKVAPLLRQRGHDVVPASRESGVDILTGAGLGDAFAGADVVVDVTNSPSFEDDAVMRFFETAGRNILAAERTAGVRHHVAVSVVGTERLLASGYFRAKMAQEKLIASGGIPYTILRATQFFEFAGSVAHATDDGPLRLSPALMQPIFSGDVAAALADVALGAPVGGIVEVAGPERFGIDEFARRFLRAKGEAREVVVDAAAGYFGTPVDDRSLTPGDHPRIGATRFDDWLARTFPK
jgi:uncharacterized protein YbjT (DUF2867 family)